MEKFEKVNRELKELRSTVHAKAEALQEVTKECIEMTAQLKEEAKALARAPRIQRSAHALNAPDHVVSSLWSGPGSVDEATKLRRKALGVVVRGAAAQCPAPLEDDVKWGDARLPQPLWRRAGAKLNDANFKDAVVKASGENSAVKNDPTA